MFRLALLFWHISNREMLKNDSCLEHSFNLQTNIPMPQMLSSAVGIQRLTQGVSVSPLDAAQTSSTLTHCSLSPPQRVYALRPSVVSVQYTPTTVLYSYSTKTILNGIKIYLLHLFQINSSTKLLHIRYVRWYVFVSHYSG